MPATHIVPNTSHVRYVKRNTCFDRKLLAYNNIINAARHREDVHIVIIVAILCVVKKLHTSHFNTVRGRLIYNKVYNIHLNSIYVIVFTPTNIESKKKTTSIKWIH